MCNKLYEPKQIDIYTCSLKIFQTSSFLTTGKFFSVISYFPPENLINVIYFYNWKILSDHPFNVSKIAKIIVYGLKFKYCDFLRP